MGRGSGGLANPGRGQTSRESHEPHAGGWSSPLSSALSFSVTDSRSFIHMQIRAAGDLGGGGVYRARVSKGLDGSRGGLA